MEQRTDDRDEADFASVHDLRIPTELNDARSLEARQMATMNAELARLRSSLATARAAEAAAVNEASALAEFEGMERQEMEERAALADDRASLRQSTEPQPEGTVAAGEGEEAELPVEMSREQAARAFVDQFKEKFPDVEEGNLAKRRWGGGRRSKRRRSNKKTRKSKRRRSKRLRSKRRKSKKKTRRS
jgi:hypothetical protein